MTSFLSIVITISHRLHYVYIFIQYCLCFLINNMNFMTRKYEKTTIKFVCSFECIIFNNENSRFLRMIKIEIF